MPSQEAQALEALYSKIITYSRADGVDLGLHRIILEDFATAAAEPTDVSYEELKCPGSVRPAIWCSPRSASPSSVILYMHGGGFTGGSPASHRKMVGHLAKRAGCHAVAIDYRLAPENQFPCQIDDVIASYKWLLTDRGFSSRNIAFAGDSAGGNLAVAASLAAKNMGLEVPGAIALFSPWIDMEMTGKSHVENLKTDRLVFEEGAMKGAVNLYVGGANLKDQLIDLLHADLTGLPPMYLNAGSLEVFRDDSVQLAERAKLAGLEVHLKVCEGVQHVWVFGAGNVREADEALEETAKFIHGKITS